MAENIPNLPTGAVPPKPAEAAKVQPKKETVRINLPPKPTAAPTIKIPAPAVAAAVAAPAAVTAVAAPPAAPAGAPRGIAAAQAAVSPATAVSTPRPAMAPMPMAAAPTIGKLDTGLAVAAALLGIAALVRVLMLT